VSIPITSGRRPLVAGPVIEPSPATGRPALGDALVDLVDAQGPAAGPTQDAEEVLDLPGAGDHPVVVLTELDEHDLGAPDEVEVVPDVHGMVI
jgi:hypothetical protein